MAKKKDKPQVINNIQELNLEIDYDKLAGAIVQAQRASDETDDQKENGIGVRRRKSKWKTFWKNVGRVIANNYEGNGNLLPATLAATIQTLFNFVSAFLALTSIVWICFLGRRIYDWTSGAKTDAIENIEFLAICFYLTVLSPVVALVFRGIANEIGREKDKNYIISVFSGLVSLVALIVAIIALFKGVG